MSVNKIYTLIGARGKGKTPFVIGGDWEPGIAKLWLQNKKMSTLILDELDHVKYQHVPILKPENYSKLSSQPGIYRTLSSQQYLRSLVKKIGTEKLVWNTNVVMEDAKKYINSKFSEEEWALIGNSKQQNCDLTFMYWNWGIASLDVIRSTNYFVIFPTSDSPEVRKKYIEGCFDKCMKAYKLVCAGKAPYLIVDSGI